MRQKYTKGLKSMTTLMTPDERRALFDRIAQIMLKQYPADRKLRPNARDDALLDEQYYATLAEYADRLPRIVVGRCPFSGQLLKRAVDVYDLSGPWWKPNKPFRPQEPPTPSTFLVLLGSLDMHGRVPNEAKESSILAGPAVPFVVPAMLNMKGVKAVITSFTLMTGDTAYVISYWSERVIDGSYLHQPWLETMLWFPNGNGGKSWMPLMISGIIISNRGFARASCCGLIRMMRMRSCATGARAPRAHLSVYLANADHNILSMAKSYSKTYQMDLW
jgi:hypothetical protein